MGYTNAGKSTLFNRLTGAGVLADAKMFATLDPPCGKSALPSRRRVLLSDTVGFIRNLPTTLVKAFRATLEEVTEAGLLLHVVDAVSAQAVGNTGARTHGAGRNWRREDAATAGLEQDRPCCRQATAKSHRALAAAHARGESRRHARRRRLRAYRQGVDELLRRDRRSAARRPDSPGADSVFPPETAQVCTGCTSSASVVHKEYTEEGCEIVEPRSAESMKATSGRVARLAASDDTMEGEMNCRTHLTLVRIFFVPLLVAALVQEGWKRHFREWDFIATTGRALAFSWPPPLTDLLDGYLARRWNQVTTVGMLLDPIADKLLISAALVSLVQVHRLPAWMAVMIIGREFAVSGLRSIAAEVGSVIAASDLGKAKMVFQVIAVGLLMASQDVPQLHPAATIAVWGVVVFAMISAADYFRRFWGLLDEKIKARRRIEVLEMERQRAALKSAEIRHRTGD